MTITVLITGANRGIGLEFVRHYAADANYRIIACCRQPDQAESLKQIAGNNVAISLMQLNIDDATSVNSMVERLQSQPIDILIANAGIMGESGVRLGNVNPDNIMHVFRVNALDQLLLVEALLPNLQAGSKKTIVAITSKMGSIDDNCSGRSYAYRASKTALNMMMKSVAIDLSSQDFTVLLLHPGWVQTAMGGPNALITVTDSVQGMTKVIANATKEDSGKFFDYQGQPVAW